MTAAIAWAFALACIPAFAVLIGLGVWAIVQGVRDGRKNGVDWSCDCTGVDVLGDGGRRLD
jgi:hypothetical protein